MQEDHGFQKRGSVRVIAHDIAEQMTERIQRQDCEEDGKKTSCFLHDVEADGIHRKKQKGKKQRGRGAGKIENRHPVSHSQDL